MGQPLQAAGMQPLGAAPQSPEIVLQSIAKITLRLQNLPVLRPLELTVAIRYVAIQLQIGAESVDCSCLT
jgi:hypothetical protein